MVQQTSLTPLHQMYLQIRFKNLVVDLSLYYLSRSENNHDCFLYNKVKEQMYPTLLPVRQALYLAAILTEQNLSTVMRSTVNCETRQTV